MRNYNILKSQAKFSLFVTSYLPLFILIVYKQLRAGRGYLAWGGLNKESLMCYAEHFLMPSIIVVISLYCTFGVIVLLKNIKRNVDNGFIVNVTKIRNIQGESIGYIATYILPLVTGDFESVDGQLIVAFTLFIIYRLYVKSNLLLVNPLLNIRYSLLEIEYMTSVDDSQHDAIIITETNEYTECTKYKLYSVGFKLYYGKEQSE